MRVWLKDLRESKGLTQQNVADYLGVTKQYYQMVESGSRAKDLTTSIVMSLATLFEISAIEIMRREQAYQKEVLKA